MTIPPKHKEFIRLVVEGGVTNTQAYRLTFPKKVLTAGTIKVEACKLAKKYAQEIAQERQRIANVIQVAQDSKVSEIAAKRIMTVADRLEYLTKVVNGEIKTKVPFVVAGKIMEYYRDPDQADKLKALAELNKMGGDYAPAKTEISGGEGLVIKIIHANS